MIRELTDLHVGAPVVHEDYGVGRYRGLTTLDVDGLLTEFLLLEYAGGDKIYVPVQSLHLVTRYTGASVGYQLASVFGGGFAPLIAVALLAAGGGDPYLVAAYMVGMAIITVVSTYFARETYLSDIGDVRADEAAEQRPATGRFVRKPAEDRETTAAR